jgi:hypothetical protein
MNVLCRTRLIVTICAVFATTWITTSIRANNAYAQNPADKLAEAQSAFDKAQEAYIGSRFDDAAAGFQAAYAAKPFPQFLYNVGASFHMKGKKASDVAAYEKAVEFYTKYITEDPKASDKAKIEKAIEVILAEIKKLKALPANTPKNTPPPAPSQEMQSLGDVKVRGLVVIESEPSGAQIFLDDKAKGAFATTPWSGSLEGEHKIIVEKSGYKPMETRLAADPGKLMVYKAGLPAIDYLGYVEVTSNTGAGADVYIDDKAAGVKGKTPMREQLPPGKHVFWITQDGYDEYKEEVEIAPGTTNTVVKAVLKGGPVGKLNINGYGVESAAIYVDGKLLCERGPCLKSVSEGSHEVSVQREGYKSYTRRISIVAKTETSVKVGLAKTPSRTDAIVAYVLAGSFAAGGTYFGLQSNKIRDELKKEIAAGTPPVDSNDPRLGWRFGLNNGKFNSVMADSLFVIAGASAITAVYYTFREKGAPSTALVDVRALSLTPTVGPAYAGLNMEVRW